MIARAAAPKCATGLPRCAPAGSPVSAGFSPEVTKVSEGIPVEALRAELDALGAELRARLDAVEVAIAVLQSRPA